MTIHNLRGRWYSDDDTTLPLHERVWSTVEALRGNDGPRVARFLNNARLYANRAIQGLTASTYNSVSEDSGGNNPAFNVIRNMTDAVQAKIAKNRPRPTFLTEGGDFGLQQSARRLEQFVAGVMYKNKLYQNAPQTFRDGAIFGVGASKVYGDKTASGVGRVVIERTFPWELHVDPLEALHGNPRSMFQTRLIDRAVLQAVFPKHAELIADAASARHEAGPAGMLQQDVFADQLLVVEGWHLPSSEGADDGLHAVVIEEGELAQEQWDLPRFPFSMFMWSKPLFGMWGDALPDEVESLQLEMNELMSKIQQAFWHNANPKWLLPTGGRIDETEIDNDLRGCVIHYSGGEAPVLQTFPTVHPEVFSHLDRMYQRSFEVAGISQLSAASRKPSGLDSAVALREFNDIESERFVIRGQDYEQYFLDTAQLIIDSARNLDAQGVDVEVRSEDRRRRRSFLTRIKWSKASMDDDAFMMKVFPASSLPQSPAGRKAAVESLIGAGMIQKQDGLALLDFPDLQAVMDRDLAPYEVILDQMEVMIDEGRYVPPEPFQDLQLAVRIANNTRLRAKMDGVPGDRLQLLQDYLDAAAALLSPPQQPAQQAPAPAGPEMPPGPEGLPAPAPDLTAVPPIDPSLAVA